MKTVFIIIGETSLGWHLWTKLKVARVDFTSHYPCGWFQSGTWQSHQKVVRGTMGCGRGNSKRHEAWKQVEKGSERSVDIR